MIHIDLVGPLPMINGKNFLFTIIDRETSWTEAIPLKEINSEAICRVLRKEWISRFGAPEIVVSDNGRQFIGSTFQQLCQDYGIEHRHTTPYHPQCNVKVERFQPIHADVQFDPWSITLTGSDEQLCVNPNGFGRRVGEDNAVETRSQTDGERLRVSFSMTFQNCPANDC